MCPPGMRPGIGRPGEHQYANVLTGVGVCRQWQIVVADGQVVAAEVEVKVEMKV